MHPDFDMQIRELENTRRVVKNLTRLIKTSSFPGTEAEQVADGLKFLKFLEENTDSVTETVRAEKKAAEKASKEEVKSAE